MKKIFLNSIIVLFLSCFTRAGAQDKQHFRIRISAEIDPMPFFQNGYSVAGGIESGHLRYSVNLFSSKLPSFALQKDWSGKIGFGSALRAQYYFKEGCKGFFAGAQAGVLRNRYTKKNKQPAITDITQFALTPTIGYRWFPFHHDGFYLMPAVGIGFTVARSVKQVSGTEAYDRPGPAYIAALHIGFRF